MTDQEERNVQLRLLAELRDELPTAARPDGVQICDPIDVNEWLKEKIRLLRKHS